MNEHFEASCLCGGIQLRYSGRLGPSNYFKAGIVHQPEIVKPAYENWVKEKVKWADINVAESNEESRKA